MILTILKVVAIWISIPISIYFVFHIIRDLWKSKEGYFSAIMPMFFLCCVGGALVACLVFGYCANMSTNTVGHVCMLDDFIYSKTEECFPSTYDSSSKWAKLGWAEFVKQKMYENNTGFLLPYQGTGGSNCKPEEGDPCMLNYCINQLVRCGV